ncbi:hypothetical protein GCM10010472_47610 [Pseudonocardia halophobica]|uniref:Uncharacterized protein n=1 Tax=Pseudonocardia halophobica TaxID=29401 RepID=A0A9W6L4M0_9PSEU|nr:hypothetical protein GCM10017577_47200 [Pseudonocardia halophobica]
MEKQHRVPEVRARAGLAHARRQRLQPASSLQGQDLVQEIAEEGALSGRQAPAKVSRVPGGAG